MLKIGYQIEERGGLTVKSKKFGEYVRYLEQRAVTLDLTQIKWAFLNIMSCMLEEGSAVNRGSWFDWDFDSDFSTILIIA